MKLPKFIKSSTHQERQQNLIKSNRQLMLTDNIFKIQPQKQSALFRDIINESKLNNDDTTKTPCTPLYNFKSNKLNDSSINVNFSSAQANGRYVKMSQPKRLQRNFQKLKNENFSDNNFQSTPVTTKFSISKITKYVSRSILKSQNDSKQYVSDDEENTEKQFNPNIYSSYDQFREIQEKINQQQTRARSNKRTQPSIGVNSYILKQLKKNQNCANVDYIAGSALINTPIIFNSEVLLDDEEKCVFVNNAPFISENITHKTSRTKITSVFKIVK
ncbi:unnamed protein product [Brachionus calyciflorus]|uniref:Uncharacterized protein n=1 Tax=Brachionus calyciflorus TaxID=104777 RepID=A0A814BE24_9BILA|nr:unnamed protein product [Brachionus calyciflorus]